MNTPAKESTHFVKILSRLLCLLCLTSVSAFTSVTANAQTWPSKPIRILVASTAGSSIDVPMRIVADRLKDRIGQPVVIENRPQAGGTVAVAEAARAVPDGYTYSMGFNGPLANAPHLFANLSYDPVKDLRAVVLVSGAPFALGVPTALGINSVKELLDRVRAKPGKLNYSSLGNGSGTHLTMEMLKTMQQLFIVHIPYVGGPAAAQALATGEVQAAFLPPAVLMPHVRSNRVKVLAVSTKDRFAPTPEVPSMQEQGVKDFDIDSWNGLTGPAGLPNEIVTRLNREVNAILVDPAVREQFAKAGLRPGGGTPEEFGALIAAETKRWGPVIKRTGLKLD